MIPFFGKTNDNRVRLYLHALEGEFRGPNGNVALTANHLGGLNGIRPELRNGSFINPDPLPSGSDSVHSEWNKFAAHLERRVAALSKDGYAANSILNQGAGAVNTPPANIPVGRPAVAGPPAFDAVNTDAILAVIKSLSGNKNPDSLEAFFQRVVLAHLDAITIPNTEAATMFATPHLNIITRFDMWGGATNFLFKDQPRIAAIYAGAGVAAGALVADTEINFGYNLDKYALLALLESAAATSLGNDNFWSTTESLNNQYYRIPSDSKKVFTTDATGAQVDVSRGSAAYMNLKIGDKCFGANVKDNNGLTCNDYIQKCIVNGKPDDIRACKDFMQNSDFWEIMQSDVDAMIPSIIVDTLDKFGFQMDSTNKKYKSYESVGSWLKGLSARVPLMQLSAAELKNITDNVKLKQYLDLLVAKVNQNPAILNENYFDSSHFDPTDQAFRFKNWTPYGLQPRIFRKVDVSSDIHRQASFITSNFARSRGFAQRRLTLLPGSALLHNGVPFSMGANLSFIMHGGSHDESEKIAKHGAFLEQLLQNTERNLNAMGKSLDVNTKMQIQKYIAQYKDSENKLIKAITYADKYIDLINVFKQYDNANTLNVDHLKSFVEARDKYFDKAESRQNTIISAIQQVADQVLEKLDNESKPVKNSSGVHHTRNN
jgi:hypothetical protein